MPNLSQEELKKLHWRLVYWIKKVGKKASKKHGAYWDFQLDNIYYHIDDFNGAISLNDFYVGCDFGGFESKWKDTFLYRYHIGRIYQYWLIHKKPKLSFGNPLNFKEKENNIFPESIL